MNPFSILVINCGSSSLKFSIFQFPEKQCIASGLAEKLNQTDAHLTIKHNGQKLQINIADADHKLALQAVFAQFSSLGIALNSIKAVGHRVVHGGEKFSSSTIITPAVLAEIEQCSALAPLHNPANVLGIHVCQELLTDTAQIAVFDTAFHQTLDASHYLYAVPWQWYEQYGVRKYGFHGTSHEYVSAQAIEQLKLDTNNSGLLIAHLGNGASAAAVANGKCVDTTMGLTPLEGLMMGTRSGDVDPSLHHYIANAANMTLDDVNNALNRESGLLGISQQSNDMRTIIEAAENGDQQCALALEMFCLKLAKHLMSLAVSLPQIDALAFTGGIGENSAIVRSKTCAHLAHFGFKINNDRNNANQLLISDDSSIKIAVIATNEELQIATHCLTFLA